MRRLHLSIFVSALPIAIVAVACTSDATDTPDPSGEHSDSADIDRADAIQEVVNDLQDIVHDGRDAWDVSATVPLEMVKEFIGNVYGEGADDFTWVENGTFATGRDEAGTVTNDVAMLEVATDVEAIYKRAGKDPASFVKRAEENMKALVTLGATFGYDASDLNDCKDPTPYLLVLDAEGGVVHGMDLLGCGID